MTTKLIIAMWLGLMVSIAQAQIETADQSQIEDEFVSFAGASVRLRMANGETKDIPIERLSADDQRDLRRYGQAHGANAETWKVLFSGPGDGLRGEFFTDKIFEVRVSPTIDFEYGRNQPPYTGGDEITPRDGWYENFRGRWTGWIVPKYSELYSFHITADDTAHLWIDDQLVVSQPVWKMNAEQSGQIKLTVGRPVTIRLAYFNGPFGGMMKLAWSSKSQPKEIIPISQLFRPADGEDDEPPSATPAPTLAGQIESRTIQLSAPVAQAPRGGWGTRPPLLLVPMPLGSPLRGAYKLGWNDRQGTVHLSTLDVEFRPTGQNLTLKDRDLRSLVVQDDGDLGVLAAELPDRMCVYRYDRAGKELFRTVLTGDKGRLLKEKYLDDLWCFSGQLAMSGTELAAHFGQVWQTDPTVAHQGGYFGTVDSAGRKVIDNQWTVSHSLDQQLIAHRGAFCTLSLGDVFPKGLWFENRTFGFGRLIFPSDEQLKEWNPGHARLGSLFPVGRNVGMVFVSEVGGSRELFLVVVRDDGRVHRTVQLTDTPQFDEQLVKAAPFGEHLLVLWREANSAKNGPNQEPPVHKAAVMNTHGHWLTEPMLLEHPIPESHDLTVLSNGDIAWLTANDGDEKLTLVRVRNSNGPALRSAKLPAELTADEKRLIELTNAERHNASLPSLKPNATLMKLARDHSANMARLNMLNHTLEGVSFDQRLAASGYGSFGGGENVAQGSRTPADAIAMWMQSAGHKDNLLNPSFQEFGVGMATTSAGERFWTQVFAAPVPGSSTRPLPAPTAEPLSAPRATSPKPIEAVKPALAPKPTPNPKPSSPPPTNPSPKATPPAAPIPQAKAPKTVPEHLDTANERLQQGNFNAAIVELLAAIQLDHKNPSWHYVLAYLQHRAGQVNDARKTVQTASELEQQRPIPNWGRLMERYQGPSRVWLENARRK